ncbi:MAG: sodium/proline symporter [Oscillospiraceae bacterium]|jgi:sodium/proline symporter|nr:sodium/proline symporter [Oscillospiraceae bacterium]
MTATVQLIIAMCIYLGATLLIGVLTAKRANQGSDEFFLGGRGLGPWVAAMSAEASDMSGWLLMGLPGVAYWLGIADAFWTALGLAIGTYVNWLITAKRLRRYSISAGNAITIPEFFSNRYKEKKPIILTVASLFILVFFVVYVGSCFVTGGKLFAQLFSQDYHVMMLVTACFVVLYTFLGGFLAESISDFMQGVVMICSLVAVLVGGVIAAGGFAAVQENVTNIPGFMEFFGMANPVTDANGVQTIVNGSPLFGDAQPYGLLTVLSTMSWGLGYFGMPQVLLRFMAIRSEKEIPLARRVASIWAVISMTIAVVIGVVGKELLTGAEILTTSGAAENVFVVTATKLFPPLIAGFIMTGILAAAMSSSDSYLLIASSAVSKNIFQGLFFKKASERAVMMVSRITLLVIAVLGIVIAWDENSVIFKVVSFAWAGFGATFGPLMLFSLFWKRTNKAGALAGILGGAGMVFFYKLFIRKVAAGTLFDIYELLPAFLFSCLLIVVVSLLTAPPEQEIQDEFDAVKAGTAAE